MATDTESNEVKQRIIDCGEVSQRNHWVHCLPEIVEKTSCSDCDERTNGPSEIIAGNELLSRKSSAHKKRSYADHQPDFAKVDSPSRR